ncbi:MAG: preprotein translocase subunit SecE [Planctomycetaceae bacterium]|nr:preprotein translocase subunit SecE [Planctomycetaceae bacterium]
MAKEQTMSGSVLQEFFQRGVYKRNQGRASRQVTFGALALGVSIGTWRLKDTLMARVDDPAIIFGVPGLLLLLGIWVSYRAVNITRFADFLIAVEAEMYKVTWPTRVELVRSSMVVMVVIFFLALVLALYDLFWRVFLSFIGVVS